MRHLEHQLSAYLRPAVSHVLRHMGFIVLALTAKQPSHKYADMLHFVTGESVAILGPCRFHRQDAQEVFVLESGLRYVVS